MALEQMEGFELAGRTVCFRLILFFFWLPNTQIHWQLHVNTVHEKGTAKYTQQDSLDEAGGGFFPSLTSFCNRSSVVPGGNYLPPLVKRWCRNLLGLNQLLLFQSLCEYLSISWELYWHKNAVPDRTFPKLCSHVQSCWKICSIPKSQSFWLSILCIWPSLLAIRETERDWDKDLAEDVKGECESKYGPVTAIKVEKETQVSYDVLSF